MRICANDYAHIIKALSAAVAAAAHHAANTATRGSNCGIKRQQRHLPHCSLHINKPQRSYSARRLLCLCFSASARLFPSHVTDIVNIPCVVPGSEPAAVAASRCNQGQKLRIRRVVAGINKYELF